MQAPVRRVVTGETSAGKAVVVSDTAVSGEPPRVGVVVHDVWGTDTPLTLPYDGARPATDGIAPPPGGFRFALVSFAPREEVLGGGMHRSDTVDMSFVVSGEIWIELDDGAETLLRTGDTPGPERHHPCLAQPGRRPVRDGRRRGRRPSHRDMIGG